MTQHQTNIEGYTADVDTDMDGDGATGCWISKIVDGRLHSASLEALINEGELRCSSSGNRDDYLHVVEQETIDAIEAWAESKGY